MADSGTGMNLSDIFEPDQNKVKPKAGMVQAADGHWYHKSSSANSTEAPTNKGTLEQAAQRQAAMAEGLDYHETEFVLMCQMYYNVHGKLIDAEAAEERYGLDATTYAEYLEKPAVRNALTTQEILKPEVPGAVGSLLPKSSVLTPKQIIVANIMMDLMDTRADKKKLQDNDCSTLEWQRWLRQPAFQSYIREAGESVLWSGQHEAALALMDRVRAGDSKAIALYWEYIGKFTPKGSSTTVNVQSGGGDTGFIVTRLIEIIIDEIDDGPLAARIADRIKGLIGAQKVANQLQAANDEDLVIPDVAPMRTQTEVIKAIETRAGVSNAE